MPQISSHIFNRKKLHSILKNKTVADLTGDIALDKINSIISNWQTLIKKGVLDRKNEVSLQDSFLKAFFCKILQYQGIADSPEEWFFEREKGTKSDATRSDGALGFFTGGSKNGVRVAVELKSAKIGLDQKIIRKGSSLTPVEQAFMYANKFGKQCKWVIVSNYKELRFYNSASMNEYEIFEIANLDKEDELKKFLYLLYRDRLIKKDGESTIDQLFRENEAEQEKISKVFYKQYQQIRIHLFEHLKKNNPAVDELALLEKTQKTLDRFIFVCFCEDTGLLPERIFRKVLDAVKSNGLMVKINAWDQIRGLFRSIDEGNPPHNINRYNGGLFAYDELLDGQLILKDEMIVELAEITNYDFESDLNVNILGHIFEQSISDIEELKSAIAGEASDKKKGKRKKEGIYYTPEYITHYIVDQAVGGWLRDRHEELGFDKLPELTEKDYESIKILKKGAIKSNKNIKRHLDFWEAYKRALSNIKILDPACGSGAFLNQAFDYLFKEGQSVNQQIADLRGGQLDIFGLDKHILKHNLFGVDLNPESVEITKLSLWLKTANNKSELTALDDNIQCGNSLIADPSVAGPKAFKWGEKFPEIIKDGGFDIVIGNPPYGAELPDGVVDALKKEYKSFEYQVNSYVVFYEQGLNLLKKNGFLGYITPATFTYQHYFKKLRSIFNQYRLVSVCKYNYEVFEDADVGDSVSWIIKKQKIKDYKFNVQICKTPADTLLVGSTKSISQVLNPDGTYYIRSDGLDFQKLYNNCFQLGKKSQIIVGIKPYQKGKGVPKQTGEVVKSKPFTSDRPKDKTYKLCLIGKDFYRYRLLKEPTMFLSYGEWLAEPRQTAPFFEEKIILRQTADSLIAHIDQNNINLNNVYNIGRIEKDYSIKYILALINSNLMNFIYQSIAQEKGRLFAEVKKIYLEKLPVKYLSKNDQRPFIEKANQMLALNKEFYKGTNKFIKFIESSFSPKNASNKLKEFYSLSFGDFLQELKKQKVSLFKKDEYELMELFESEKKKALDLKSQIEQTDREINQMVYDLYDLTPEEIITVESPF